MVVDYSCRSRGLIYDRSGHIKDLFAVTLAIGAVAGSAIVLAALDIFGIILVLWIGLALLEPWWRNPHQRYKNGLLRCSSGRRAADGAGFKCSCHCAGIIRIIA